MGRARTLANLASDGDINFDSNTLFIDSSNDRVGIGEATPIAPLHVSSGDSGASASVHSDELFVEGSGNSGITIGSGTSGFGNVRFADSGGTDQGIVQYSHGDDRLQLFTDGTKRLSIDSDGVKFNNDTAADNALDDYEQGTFNFTLSGYWGSPSPKLTIPAHYTKIGNVVHFWAHRTSMNTTGYSGNMTFQGLPFTSPSPYSIGTLSLDHIGTYSGYGPHLLISGNDTYGVLHQSNASSWSAIMHNVHTSAGAVYLTGHYKV